MEISYIYTVSRTARSLPLAYFANYVEAKAYNDKWLAGKYVVQQHEITRM